MLTRDGWAVNSRTIGEPAACDFEGQSSLGHRRYALTKTPSFDARICTRPAEKQEVGMAPYLQAFERRCVQSLRGALHKSII
ncbi:hypothetical protein N183_19115 [Sinorhizobium sp. Sb3]|nr:hypothetical protein N183_19115 [Sinorhizobium sp. Sb3]